MPQNPSPINIAVKSTSPHSYAPGTIDSGGNFMFSNGGINSALNVTAAAVIKATPGRLARITVVVAPTTSGALTINDCATTGAAATANEIASIPYNATAMVAGATFVFDWPCLVGIVISAVGGGSPQYSVSYS